MRLSIARNPRVVLSTVFAVLTPLSALAAQEPPQVERVEASKGVSVRGTAAAEDRDGLVHATADGSLQLSHGQEDLTVPPDHARFLGMKVALVGKLGMLPVTRNHVGSINIARHNRFPTNPRRAQDATGRECQIHLGNLIFDQGHDL